MGKRLVLVGQIDGHAAAARFRGGGAPDPTGASTTGRQPSSGGGCRCSTARSSCGVSATNPFPFRRATASTGPRAWNRCWTAGIRLVLSTFQTD